MRRLIEPGIEVVFGAARPAPQRQVVPARFFVTVLAVLAGIVVIAWLIH
jgi:hypothetical protein